MKKILFIEGTPDRSNGILSQGFHKLLKQVLDKNMPRIIMGKGKHQAINKFKNNRFQAIGFLLIDLDAPEDRRATVIEEESLDKDYVFFMIQEMEAWFLSQPDVLIKFYGYDVTSRLPKRPPKEVPDPAMVLDQISRPTKKKKYHKVRDATILLEMLDAKALRIAFKEFDDLVSSLNSNI